MKTNLKSLLLLLLFFFSSFFFPSHSVQNENTKVQQPHPYWLKIKALFNHAQAYLFPPNLDFRGSISNDEPVIEGEGEGSKVKEAVAKSLGKGTAAVEESAKSAAQKLKQTLSSSQSHHQTQEL